MLYDTYLSWEVQQLSFVTNIHSMQVCILMQYTSNEFKTPLCFTSALATVANMVKTWKNGLSEGGEDT